MLYVSEDWLRLDRVAVPNIEDVRKRFRLFVAQARREWKNTEGVSYMDDLSTDNHVVFISHSLYKTFGHFIGSNGKGDALLRVQHSTSVISVPPNLVISM